MQIGKTILAKFGLLSQANEAPDAFALRLERINMRESRRQVRAGLFRSPAQPLGV